MGGGLPGKHRGEVGWTVAFCSLTPNSHWVVTQTLTYHKALIIPIAHMKREAATSSRNSYRVHFIPTAESSGKASRVYSCQMPVGITFYYCAIFKTLLVSILGKLATPNLADILSPFDRGTWERARRKHVHIHESHGSDSAIPLFYHFRR